jgi:hypothetical protein
VPVTATKPTPPVTRGVLYYARRPFLYCGRAYDRGEVLELQGARTDEKLVRIGYVALVSEAHPGIRAPHLPECGPCGGGRRFVKPGFLEAHGDERHRRRPEEIEAVASGKAAFDGRVSAFEDRTGDRLERKLQAEAPLYLDKTTASQAG